ncbi:MAG: CAP domain-containing protein [Eubacteriales bacterium]
MKKLKETKVYKMTVKGGIACLCMGLTYALSQELPDTQAFGDVNTGDWYYNAIYNLTAQDYLSGESADHFGIGQTLTLAEFTTMIANAFYGDTVSTMPNQGNWWEHYLTATFYRNGMSNTTAGKYYIATGSWGDYPHKGISRYDMASIVTSLLMERGMPAISNEMVQMICSDIHEAIPTEYQNDVATAYYYKILEGRDDKTFDGYSTLNRQEGAAVLYALINFSPISTEKYVEDNDSGNTGGGSGNTGGDSGNTGGDSGNTGGDSGNSGGDSGNSGGDSGNSGGTSGNVADLDEFVLEVFYLVNQTRKQYGLSDFVLDSNLCALAQYKSDEMSELNYLDHTSPTYGVFSNILSNNGIFVTKARENLARGQHSPAEVVYDWMNSTEHRNNILATDVGKIGIGYTADGYYWSQLFVDSNANTGGELSGDLGGTGAGGNTSGDYSYSMEVPYYQYNNYFVLGYTPSDCLVTIPVKNTGDYTLVFDSLTLSGPDAFYFQGFVSASTVPVGGTEEIILEPMAGLSIGSYTVDVEFSVENLPPISQTITVYVGESTAAPDLDSDEDDDYTLPDGLIPDAEENLKENAYTVSFHQEGQDDVTLKSSSQSQWFYETNGKTAVQFTLSKEIPEGVELDKVTISHGNASVESARLELDKSKLYVIFDQLSYSNQIVNVNVYFKESYRVVQQPAEISVTVLRNGDPIKAGEFSPYILESGDTVEVIIPEGNVGYYVPQVKDSTGTLLIPDKISSYGNRSSGIYVVDDQDLYLVVAKVSG